MQMWSEETEAINCQDLGKVAMACGYKASCSSSTLQSPCCLLAGNTEVSAGIILPFHNFPVTRKECKDQGITSSSRPRKVFLWREADAVTAPSVAPHPSLSEVLTPPEKQGRSSAGCTGGPEIRRSCRGASSLQSREF